MIRAALIGLLLFQSGDVTLKYGVDKAPKDKVFTEMKLGIKIEGSDQLTGFVRSLHPFLSMEKLVVRADGTRQVVSAKKQKIEYDEARVECRYDDEDHEYDYQKGQAPEGDKDKLKQMMWFFAAAGRSFSLSAEGEYRSDDPNQDHNGEAMDLITLAITRMPDRAVKEGDSYEREWKGAREEKDKKKKKGRFAFRQKVKVEKIEEKDGRKVATLSGDLTGKLEGGEKDPSAEEAWSRVEGKTRTVIEVASGRVLSAEGLGKVVAYHRGTAENGSKQELTLTFTAEGKTSVK